MTHERCENCLDEGIRKQGGMSGKKHKPETIEKMRRKRGGLLNPMFGKKRPELSQSNSKRVGSLNPNFGKKNPAFAENLRKECGPLNRNWRGGRMKASFGYILAYCPGHHRANKKGYVLEHILVAEKKYQREIKESEIIHHIDLDRQNNDPDNLILFENIPDHCRYHQRLKQYFD